MLTDPDLSVLTGKVQSLFKRKSDGKFDSRNFQLIARSVPLCLGTAAILR